MKLRKMAARKTAAEKMLGKAELTITLAGNA
jgi:hypothetical protein